jgi:hypothetical protein
LTRQSNQSACQRKGFFAREAFALQSRQNHGLQNVTPLRSLKAHASATIAMPYPARGPELFCRLSAEAVSLTGDGNANYVLKIL